MEVFSLQKVVSMPEEVLVSWREVRWTWRMRKTSVAQFIKLLKCWLCDMRLRIVVEENWVFSRPMPAAGVAVFRCISSICWAYFSDAMVSLGFRKWLWIRQAADHQTVTMTFFGASLALGSALELLLSPTTELVIASCLLNPLFVAHSNVIENVSLLLHRIREDDSSKWLFFDVLSVHKAPTYWALHLSNLLQMPNDLRMVNTEFFGNFPCSWKRISFDDLLHRSLSTFDGLPLHSSSSRLSSPLQNMMNHSTALYNC